MKKVSFFAVSAFCAVLFLVGGCASTSENNHLTVADFARKLQSDGFKIEVVRPLDPSPLSAKEALEFTIDGANIGVYKYDITVKKQRERLKNIKKNNTVYFVGFPYPVYEVSGSFIVVGLDKHKQKKRILKSLRNFK
ncbi:MAG: hypothetical protein E7058_00135 [Lentisphaerae bacterium]|nr:hypothetical protein [Lentisphaerota bacterium]